MSAQLLGPQTIKYPSCSRSRSRDRRRSRSRDRKRSRSRDHRSSRRGRSSSTSSEEYGGYIPRRRQEPAKPGEIKSDPKTDPYYYLRQQKVTTETVPGADAQRMWQEQQLQARLLVLQQQATSAAAANSKTQREVYVGNLTPGTVTADAIRQVFSAYLAPLFPQFSSIPGMDAVVNVNLHSDGRYAFVEMRTPEMATASLQLSGTQLGGSSFTVGRPSGYVDPMKAANAAQAAALALDAFKKGDMEALAAAGAAGANLAGLNIPGMPSTYSNPGLASMVVISGGVAAAPGVAGVLPGMGLPGLAGMPAASVVAAGAVAPPAPPSGPHPSVVAGLQQQVAAAAAVAAVHQVPTPYLRFTGMISAAMLEDDEEYEFVKEDLEVECSKFAAGSVVAIKVPRPPSPSQAASYIGQGNYGKAFVQFTDALSAVKAKEAIHGRLFAGSVVIAEFVVKEVFESA